jgi:hypothetical protein
MTTREDKGHGQQFFLYDGVSRLGGGEGARNIEYRAAVLQQNTAKTAV